MKQNTAENREFFEEKNTHRVGDELSPPTEKISYARILRTIGHALETHRVVTCNLTVENDVYTIKGSVRPPKRTRPSLFRSLQVLFTKPGAPARQATD